MSPKKSNTHVVRKKANHHVDGVTLVDGLRPHGAGFQADFRRWGGGQPTLRFPGSSDAIRDPAVANARYLAACGELEHRAKDAANGLSVTETSMHPTDYIPAFMRVRYATSALTKEYLDGQAHYLGRIFEETSFKALTSIQQIDRKAITQLVLDLSAMRKAHPQPFPPEQLLGIPVGQHKESRRIWDEMNNRLSPETVRVMIMALSALITHAIHEGDYTAAHPVSRHRHVPKQSQQSEAEFLEVEEAGRMLARLESEVSHWRSPYAYEMFAVLLYTGMRKHEMMRMRPQDIRWEEGRIMIYGTKNDRGRRSVRLWPALAAILRPFFDREGLFETPRSLLFPGSPRAGRKGQNVQRRESMLRVIKRVARDVGIKKLVTHHTTRHTYASVRLQMVQNVDGRLVPVAKLEIMRELGHGSEKMLDRVYGHVLQGRFACTELDYMAAPVVIQ